MMSSVGLGQVVEYLDALLRVREVPDNPRALNGLQVDAGNPSVTRVAVAVDACFATADAAAKARADLLVVHHGLFWGGTEPVTGRHGRRIRRLIEAGVSLYSVHVPLDLHHELGNNAILANDLGLEDLEPFGRWDDVHIGYGGTVDLSRDELTERLAVRLGVQPRLIATGPERVRRVAVVTGAASSLLAEARDAGYDTFISGEGPHHTYFDAEEWGINLLYGGHYATETLGVQALGRHLEKTFGLPWLFIDHPTGL